MEKIDIILLKLHHKAKEQAFKDLLEKFKDDKKMIKKIKEVQRNENSK